MARLWRAPLLCLNQVRAVCDRHVVGRERGLPCTSRWTSTYTRTYMLVYVLVHMRVYARIWPSCIDADNLALWILPNKQ